jgi:chromosomal replication initiation ATPase DnaA
MAKIVTALKEEIKFLPDYIIEEVSSYFNIRKEEMACYIRKQSRKGQWI